MTVLRLLRYSLQQTVSVVQAMFVAAVIGVLVVVDACYRNPPIDQGSP